MGDDHFLTLHELVAVAHRRLSANDWDFVYGGTETETTMRRNRLAIDTVALRPRVLRNVSTVDLQTTFLEKKLRLPVILAPIGRYRFGGGPDAVGKAADDFGCGVALSSVNVETSLEQFADAAPETAKVYQLYVRGDAKWINEQIRRAEGNGYSAFCITVDTAVISRRERDIVNTHMVGSARDTPDLEYLATFDWDGLKRVRDQCSLPLILKGISTAEDAGLAVGHGVDAVYVSNHGGRQPDHAEGSLDALKEVHAELNGRVRLIVDGSFYRGSDVVKALALGADAVGIGRLHCYALAAAGEQGVVRMLELLEVEMRMCMQLLGVTRISDLNSSHVKSTTHAGGFGLRSAFPLLPDTVV